MTFDKLKIGERFYFTSSPDRLCEKVSQGHAKDVLTGRSMWPDNLPVKRVGTEG